MSGLKEGAKPSNIFFLDKIFSLRKQLQVFDILQAPRPTHEERLWLVGFLKYVGYSQLQVFDIVDKHGQWSDYNATITDYQIATVFNSHHTPGNHETHRAHRRARKWDLPRLEVRRIQVARSDAMNRSLDQELKKLGVVVYEHTGTSNAGTLAGDFK